MTVLVLNRVIAVKTTFLEGRRRVQRFCRESNKAISDVLVKKQATVIYTI